ncbi:hypothetical protein [Spirosoma flavum]|uniref:Yip1 domain-containing protein n=1 Tax=Spirosoma flavum TaxID=2048557 RepID=A0ABW6AT06_9BACT
MADKNKFKEFMNSPINIKTIAIVAVVGAIFGALVNFFKNVNEGYNLVLKKPEGMNKNSLVKEDNAVTKINDTLTIEGTAGITQPDKESWKAKKVWLWCISLMAIVSPLLLFQFGYIEPVWLNRVGIILNFIAGFLVAPDLIGIDRLETFENRVEVYLNQIHLRSRWGNYIFPWRPDNIGRLPLIQYGLFVVVALLLILITIIGSKHYLIASTILITYSLACAWDVYKKSFWRDQSWKETIEDYFLSIFSIIPILKFAIEISIVFLIRSIAGRLLIELKGDRQLIKVLIQCGVLFFIMGNLMQLLATF